MSCPAKVVLRAAQLAPQAPLSYDQRRSSKRGANEGRLAVRWVPQLRRSGTGTEDSISRIGSASPGLPSSLLDFLTVKPPRPNGLNTLQDVSRGKLLLVRSATMYR